MPRTIVIAAALASLGITRGAVCTPSDALERKHAMTHEDLWLMKRVGSPVPSPDGRWVLFPVTEPSYDEKAQSSDLWIAPGDGSAPPRRLTASKARENDPCWSRDSRRIAFSTQREEDPVPQIYVMDVSGGEAVRITRLSTGARAPQFSPDGTRVLFVSQVYRGALTDADNQRMAAAAKSRAYRARVYEGFPVRFWDSWLDPDLQPHLFVQSLDTSATAVDVLAGSTLVTRAGFAGRRTEMGEDLDAVWTPDGGGIVFAASVDQDAAAYAFTHTNLFQVSVDGAEPRQLTSLRGTWSEPQFSFDGRQLYALFEGESGATYSVARIAALPWPEAGAERIVSADLDRSVSSFGVAADGEHLYAVVEDTGHSRIATLTPRGHVVLPEPTSSGAYASLAIASQASPARIFATWESAISPAEVVRIDPQSGQHTALTHFNAESVSRMDWQPVREFVFTSRRGRQIHNLLVLPPRFDESARYPLLVLIHGGPHYMWSDVFLIRWNYNLLTAPGYVLLLTNFTGSTGFGERFARQIQGDPFRTPADEVNQAADEVVKRFPFIDRTRMCAGGGSYGAHLANWLQASTARYRCLISNAGAVNLESQYGTSDSVYWREVMNGGTPWRPSAALREQNPIRHADRFRTPVLVMVGELDYRVPLNNSLEYWTALQRQRVPSRLVVFPEENHWIRKGEDSRYFYQEVHAWLDRWLKTD